MTSLYYTVMESTRHGTALRPTQRESRPEVARELEKYKDLGYSESAPVIGSWIEACFPGDSSTSKAGIEELIVEAAEAARSDFCVDAANEWANRYTIPRVRGERRPVPGGCTAGLSEHGAAAFEDIIKGPF